VITFKKLIKKPEKQRDAPQGCLLRGREGASPKPQENKRTIEKKRIATKSKIKQWQKT
jgi:hypothetical protein